jgi:carbon-monoxide dehydrogenase medium subunit
LAPAALIDLNFCGGLQELRRSDTHLIVGAMVRQAAAGDSDLVRSCCPLITAAIPFLGSRTIRNRGTIGGTIAHADRSAELPAVALALDAIMIAEGSDGRRQIPASEFFLGDLTTALAPDELLCEIQFPVASSNDRCAFLEATNRHHDLALVGVAVNVSMDGDVCRRVAISVHGVGPKPSRLHLAESCLQGQTLDQRIMREGGAASLEGVSIEGDLHATAEYRRRVLPGLVERALTKALRLATNVS